ncbi:MAG: hypothetical protein QXL77_05135 [Candidatus Bathyarchaeia archaeon]|nr:hypothetical protein [Candidatus Bathyarchaeota archaeon]
MDRIYALSLFLISLGALLVLHHLIFWQRPFDLADMLHHEFFEAILFTAGVTLLVARRSYKKRGSL